ncbi:MAG TPA: putative maltokinase [Roseiflexaceae bacterium]|nr:putative maltokinase [Roseiflexaceae bacterium]HMP39926.1 putative maltokinase [Roseiflexaceae bacterium]
MASGIEPVVLCDALAHIDHAWLRGRRWFSSKGRTIASITVADWGSLPLDEPAILALLRVGYTRGRDEILLLPVAALAAESCDPAHAALLQISHAGIQWVLIDAFLLPDFQRLLIDRLIEGVPLALTGGRIDFAPAARLQALTLPRREIRLVTAEQSNTSIIYDRQAILKCFRRVVAGINPDVEVAHFLTSHTSFTSTPALLGSMAYTDAAGVVHSLGMLQEFVANQGDMWQHVQAHLTQLLATATTAPDATLLRRHAAVALAELTTLGERTGALHQALASDVADPAFAPQPLTASQAATWEATIRDECRVTLADLAQRSSSLPSAVANDVAVLLADPVRVEAGLAGLTALGQAGVTMTRFHGDYHLGQVLVSERGLLILDFEGEPLRTLAERRAHGSPLKDVAGMLRSLSYAATAAAFASGAAMAHAWAAIWEAAAREAFLAGYCAATAGASFMPPPPVFRAAVAAFEIEKAIYELNYELNNRPDWLAIPLRGILQSLAE